MSSGMPGIGFTTLIRPGKTIEESDYEEIKPEVITLKAAKQTLEEGHVRIDMGHPHRFWEYGRALHYALAHYNFSMNTVRQKTFLDVGGGYGLLGITAAIMGFYVVETDPDKQIKRAIVNDFINTYGVGSWRHCNFSMEEIEEQYDVVCCISVMEHLPLDKEKLAWKKLADLVSPGGCLFITVDYMHNTGKSHVMDYLRTINFDREAIQERLQILSNNGMKVCPMDFTDYGNHVFDYTFLSIAATKE